MESLVPATEPEPWPQIAPLLDDAVAQLSEADRNAVVLRYYQQKPLDEVGQALGVNADTAQKRVSRALEKLRKLFSKRGVTLTATVIAGAIASNSVQAAPMGLAVTVTAAKGAAIGGSTLTIIKGALKIMAWTKAKTAIVVAVVTVAGISATTVLVNKVRQPQLAASAYPGDWIWDFNSQSLDRVPPLLLIQPTKMPASWTPGEMFGRNRYMARGKTVKELIAAVYSQRDSRAKFTFVDQLPDDKLDCIVVTSPDGKWWDALGSEIDKRFDLVTQLQNTEAGPVVEIRKKP